MAKNNQFTVLIRTSVKKYLGDMVNGTEVNVVFFQLNCVTFEKSVQKNDFWTPAQQQHRQRLGQASRLWRKIKHSKIQAIWNLGAQKRNGYSLFIEANMPAIATLANQSKIT